MKLKMKVKMSVSRISTCKRHKFFWVITQKSSIRNDWGHQIDTAFFFHWFYFSMLFKSTLITSWNSWIRKLSVTSKQENWRQRLLTPEYYKHQIQVAWRMVDSTHFSWRISSHWKSALGTLYTVNRSLPNLMIHRLPWSPSKEATGQLQAGHRKQLGESETNRMTQKICPKYCISGWQF